MNATAFSSIPMLNWTTLYEPNLFIFFEFIQFPTILNFTFISSLLKNSNLQSYIALLNTHLKHNFCAPVHYKQWSVTLLKEFCAYSSLTPKLWIFFLWKHLIVFLYNNMSWCMCENLEFCENLELIDSFIIGHTNYTHTFKGWKSLLSTFYFTLRNYVIKYGL